MENAIQHRVIVVHGVGRGDAKTRIGYSTKLRDLVLKEFEKAGRERVWLEAPWEGVNDNLDAAIKKILQGILDEAARKNGKRLAKHVTSWWTKARLFLGRNVLMAAKNVLPSLLDVLLDLPLYLDAVRSRKVKETVVNRIREVPDCVLVGHSLGSVICHDILSQAVRDNAPLPVRALVTFGSPLQWIEELRQADDPDHRPGAIAIPWTNLFYRSDPICRHRPLRPGTFTGVVNVALKRQRRRAGIRDSFKSHTAYWTDPAVAKTIRDYCCESVGA